MVQAILFDLEGVVADTEHLWDAMEDAFLRRRNITADVPALKARFAGRALAENMAWLQREYGIVGDIPVLVEERIGLMADLLASGARYVPGFLEFHAAYASRYAMAIATALDLRLLPRVDEALDLGNRFAGHIYTIADVGYRSKPDPAVFLYAANRLGVVPQECLVIEDSPNGVAAAKCAGMYTVGLARTFPAAALTEADTVIHAFEELTHHPVFV